jgi:hypothetical protein
MVGPEQGTEVLSLIDQNALNYLGFKSVVKCNANLNGNKAYSSSRAKSEY